MDSDERHRLATMIDLALRDSTNEHERRAAVTRIAAMTGGQSLADIVTAITTTSATPPRIVLSERAKPWLQWKTEHEALRAECEQLRRRVAVLESSRYEKMRPKPDADGNISYPSFLIALLAACKWHVRGALSQFSQLANIDQAEVFSWHGRGVVPYYYYQLLTQLPLSHDAGSSDVEWNDDAVAMLRAYFATSPVPPDAEIAKEMTGRLGTLVSPRSINAKAHKLGLLSGIRRAGRRLK